MAKPNPVASTDGASSSTSPPPHPPRHRQGHKPRRRRRKAASAATTAARSLAPSSTLLSLLSVVVASSVAEGSPAPPAFLCPSIEPRATPTPVRRRHKRSTSTASSELKSSVPRAVVRNIADKYEQGEDGIWRRVESYTLYGVCPVRGPYSLPFQTTSSHARPRRLVQRDRSQLLTSKYPGQTRKTLPPTQQPQKVPSCHRRYRRQQRQGPQRWIPTTIIFPIPCRRGGSPKPNIMATSPARR